MADGEVPEDSEPHVPSVSAADEPDSDNLLEFDAEVEEVTDTTATVTRSASFAEVARRPKKTAIHDDDNVDDVVFYESLLEFDSELAGVVRAKSKSAATGVRVVHPAQVRERAPEEPTELEQDITTECRRLATNLGLDEEAMSYFVSLIVHGNDPNHIKFEAERDQNGQITGKVTDLDPLPLRALTIIDRATAMNNGPPSLVPTDNAIITDTSRVITEPDLYVLNEGTDHEQPIPSEEVLHLKMNHRRNWRSDRKGRSTFGIWGRRQLEPVKFAIQAKNNTLSNKVAIDDKLVAREYYKIDVETLFGHIEDDDERTEKAEAYARELRGKLSDLDPDEKPVIPQEVEVEIKTPEGKKASEMASFIEQMNNGIQHALNFHVASFGRDSGGAERGNRPAKEMSETSVMFLQNRVAAQFNKLFKMHTLLKFPEAREEVDAQASNPLNRWELVDDVTLPKLSFRPASVSFTNDMAQNAIKLYSKGVLSLNEARSLLDHDPVTEDEIEERMFKAQPSEPNQEEGGSAFDDSGSSQNDDSDDDSDDDSGDGDGDDDGSDSDSDSGGS